MALKIVAVGKKCDPWVQTGIETYSKRLHGPWACEWVLLPYSSREGLQARSDESEAILARVKDRDYVVLLDEVGHQFSSPALSRFFADLFTNSRDVVVIIGGAYGVDDRVKSRADYVWSLSSLVFPHQLARLILTEQLYRAQAIEANHPYHHI